MGGTIAVESTPGRGSTFAVRLRLPITEMAREAVAAPIDVIADFHTRLADLGRPARILLAEDNATNQLVAVRLLRDFNVQVDVVGDGLEAVHAASNLPYDVICMDVRMPEMDGLAATRTIRARGGQLRTVPIIALTANAFPEDMAACFAAGMTGFVAKPVSKQTLVAALLAALGRNTIADVTGVRASEPEPRDEALDLREFARLKDDIGGDSLARVVTIFEAETRNRLALIADRDLDPSVLLREVHSIKGTAQTVCAVLLSGRAAALELRMKHGQAIHSADVIALTEAFEAWSRTVQDAEMGEAQAA
jgi:hypothetical protein